MSRLIVKGLPKYFDEDKLREHFSKQGNVTDVKLMKKRNGESRRFAFIGYKSYDDAEKAARFFNRSFIDTAKIDVELAKTFSDPDVPMSFKDKRRQEADRLRREEDALLEQEEMRQIKKQRYQKSNIDEEIEKNPKLREYMEVMKPSHQVKSWANDAVVDGSGAPSSKALEDALNEGSAVPNNKYEVAQAEEKESDDEYEDFGKKPEDEEEQEEQMMSLDSLPQREEENNNEIRPAQDDNIATDENVTDLDWLKSRRIRMKEVETPEEEEPVSSTTIVSTAEKVPETQEKEVRRPRPAYVAPPAVDPTEAIITQIGETGRLFIRNILYESTEEDFRQLFQKYGALEEVHIAVDTRTGKSKGFVYVQFVKPANAISAFKGLDKQIFQGRLLHILPGQKKKDHRLDEFDLKNMPLKKQRELKKKAQASKSQFSWNSLFMNTDAVLDSVASKMGISKAQLIDVESSNSSVKQALAEAHVIGDVRKYFEDRGVDLTTFDKKERDDKVILVKNFAFGTSIEEIGELFSQYGELKRLLMPPAGTIAIVEFRDAPSARSAFTKLAYRMFKKGILYLEKGPKDLFTREPSAGEAKFADDQAEEETKAIEAKVSINDIMGDSEKIEDEDQADIDGPTVSVFVKNLNFSTTSPQLTKVFQSVDGFVIATVKTKADPKNEGEFLSMGFGFAEFRTKEQANVAISLMDGHVLDGHKLQLKLSHRQGSGGSNATKIDKSNKSNKIIVKNLPFETTRKDILELFGAFGQLKSVRVPRKFDKSARGFAFVEFNLLKEAESAMNQLEGVHLLGRRLVMQFAEQDAEDAEAEIEKMTRKVQKQVASQHLSAIRLAGKSKIDLEEKEDEFEGL